MSEVFVAEFVDYDPYVQGVYGSVEVALRELRAAHPPTTKWSDVERESADHWSISGYLSSSRAGHNRRIEYEITRWDVTE